MQLPLLNLRWMTVSLAGAKVGELHCSAEEVVKDLELLTASVSESDGTPLEIGQVFKDALKIS